MNISCQRAFTRMMVVCFSLVLCPAAAVQAMTAAQINAEVAGTLAQFRKDVPNANEYLKEAKAVLVIPNVKKVGFVVAGQWGTGALQIGGRNVEYYTMNAGSYGFQAGAQKSNFVFIFFTKDALNKFRNGEGFTVGAESGLTVVDNAVGMSADTLKNQNAVAGFVFGKEGLMGGWSAKGTKFSRITPDK
jgi:lipid-binding SYLF domain-containing protein